MSCVDQRTGTGVGRVQRLLSRALLVAGGTLAATAAAWALSTSAASAQAPVDRQAVAGVTPDALVPGGVVEAVLSPELVDATPVTGTAVDRAVRELDAALGAPRVPAPAQPDLRRVAEELRDAVGGVRDWIGYRPVEREPVAVIVGGAAAPPVTETTPAATAVPVSAGTPVVHGVFGKLSRTWLDAPRPAVAAQPAEGGSSLPGDPSGVPSMPFAPLGAPAHCACGGDGSGGTGGGSGSLAEGRADHTDPAAVRALRPATERNSVMPGKQPGTTPD